MQTYYLSASECHLLLIYCQPLCKTTSNFFHVPCWHSPIFVYGKCVSAFLFELVLCELTLILLCQLEEMDIHQGVFVQPLVLMCHCCAEGEGQEHLMLCHWGSGEIC